MPSLTPKQPNFYSKALSRPNTAGLSAVQASGTATNGNNYSARSTQNRRTPGASTSSLGRNLAGTVPDVSLQGLIRGAAAGVTAGLVDTALNAAGLNNNKYYYANGSRGYYNPYFGDPSSTRLYNNNMPFGGVYGPATDGSLPEDNFTPVVAYPDTEEDRVILKDQTGLFIDKSAVFAPLKNVGGMLFPYTPIITTSHKANYESESLLHTNYANPYYKNSVVDNINIQGRFTAQTDDEGQFVMAMIHFFRTVTKMFYGASTNRGTPPPVLYLDAHGKYMFDHIPVVVSSFQYTLPNDVNYITTTVNGIKTKVPVDLNVTVDLIPTYSRNKISNQFDLIKFSNGGLLTSGNGKRSGGWI
jgi:hypothetical protein